MTHSRLKAGCLVVAVLAVPAATIGSSAVAAPKKRPTIVMSGSTSVAPLARKLAKRYIKQYPGRVKFRLLQGGSDVGIADVAAGRSTIGNSSRDPKPSEAGGIVFNKIARDALCVVTHSNNRIGDLSQAAVQDIFTGKVRDWSAVPGATISGPINIVVRAASSGTQDAFDKLFLGSGNKVASSASQKNSNGLVQSSVRSDPQAIGYVSLAFGEGLNTPTFKGTPCTLQDAKSGAYQGSRNFFMVTRGPKRGASGTFITWVQSSNNARKVISTEWVPAF